MKQLHVSDSVAFPLELMTLATAVLANRGAGKTYTASVIAEELLDAGQQVVCIDPVGVMWGLKSGYSIPVFGGEHGDLPLSPASGEELARAVVENRFSLILDTSDMTNSDALRFVGTFLHELYRYKARHRESCYVIVDEADMFAPQGATSGNAPACLGAMQFLVRRGRARGLGCALVTQRPQAIAKDVLTQCEVLVAMRMSHNLDIGAVKLWIQSQATASESEQLVGSLPSMPTGEAWFWAPSLRIFKRGKVRQRKTFDSSATPKPGTTAAEPKSLAPVDLEKLGQQIAATVEEKKANDPGVLKARIRQLEQQVAKPQVAIIDESKLTELREQLRAAILDKNANLTGFNKHLDEIDTLLIELSNTFSLAIRGVNLKIEAARTSHDVLHDPLPVLPPAQPIKIGNVTFHAPPLPAKRIVEGTTELNGPKQQILNAIATFKHAGVPARPSYIAGFCGTTARARGFEENMRQLRATGMVTTVNGVLDSNGYGHPGDIGGGMNALRKVLSTPQFTMLETVQRSRQMSAEMLAQLMGTTIRARGFEENLRRLRADELLTGGKDALTVAEWLG